MTSSINTQLQSYTVDMGEAKYRCRVVQWNVTSDQKTQCPRTLKT